jgi:galactokinase
VSRTFWAPGRVNLIGEHTDYTGGLVLPAALDRGIRIDGDRADRIELGSDGFEPAVDLPADGGSEHVEGWGRYAQAVAAELAKAGRPAAGFRGRIGSTIPPGAGLSSSAALEVALALALSAVADFQLDPMELVLLAQRAEHAAVGVPCGVMDQAISLLGRSGHALLLDTESLEHRQVPLPPGIAFTIVDSGVRRRLEDSAYAERRDEVERAVALLGGRRASEVSVPEADALAARANADELLSRRLRHVVSENERVREVVEVLERHPIDRARLGRVLRAGHDSLRDDLEVSTPELDLLVDLAYGAGAVGSRMMGGGFGGSVIVLVDAERADPVASAIVEQYVTRTGIRAVAYTARAADGARELTASR